MGLDVIQYHYTDKTGIVIKGLGHFVLNVGKGDKRIVINPELLTVFLPYSYNMQVSTFGGNLEGKPIVEIKGETIRLSSPGPVQITITGMHEKGVLVVSRNWSMPYPKANEAILAEVDKAGKLTGNARIVSDDFDYDLNPYKDFKILTGFSKFHELTHPERN